MKTLYLLRHGKSDWDADYQGDHERPLASRGVKAARRVGKFMAIIDAVPELVLTSTAVRARTTFEAAQSKGNWSCESRLVPDIYESNPQSILYMLAESGETADSVMLVGHEPTWSGTVRVLTGGRVRFPTACVARIDLMINSWAEIQPASGELQWLLPPRLLK
ncbi:MAG: histidine phosphatase family protein [Rhodothermales bacterium]|nr:histidine phosphatase family protein [Rhodothermales bacterium]